MSKTVQELLSERYMVNTPWPPLNNFKKGDIVTPDQFTGWHPKDYPVIFRRLEWWEERTVDEMPEYVKYDVSGEVVKFKDHWNGDRLVVGQYGWSLKLCQPATLTEYNQYINKQ